MPTLEELRFPIGKFTQPEVVSNDQYDTYIKEIEKLPYDLRESVSGLTEAQLDTQYREGGWTVRQVVHHVPDSHVNAYIRMKFAVTEDSPVIKSYEEAKWAELPEAKSGPADMSIDLLDALHRRWVMFLRALTADDFGKAYMHPELGKVTLDEALALYSWHCRHHGEHIRQGLGLKA